MHFNFSAVLHCSSTSRWTNRWYDSITAVICLEMGRCEGSTHFQEPYGERSGVSGGSPLGLISVYGAPPTFVLDLRWLFLLSWPTLYMLTVSAYSQIPGKK